MNYNIPPELQQWMEEQMERMRMESKILTQEIEYLRSVTQREEGNIRKSYKLPGNAPEFSGKKGENFPLWCARVETLLNNICCPREKWVDVSDVAIKDVAATWSWNIRRINPEIDWNQWKESMESMFQPASYQHCLRKQLRMLKQKTDVRSYVGEFMAIAGQIKSMDQADLIGYFIDGLKKSTKEEVDYRVPDTIQEAIKIATNFDEARWSVRESFDRPTGRRHNSSVSTEGTPSLSRFPQPMELGALSGAEREKLRRERRCFRCGEIGHMANVCSNNFKIEKKNVSEMNIVHLNEISSDLLFVDGCINGRKFVKAMFDSGASHNFISNALILNLKLTLKELAKLKVIVADGRSLQVKGEVEFDFEIAERSWRLKAFVLEGLSHNLILGQPFCRLTNPNINWRTREVRINGVLAKKYSPTTLFNLNCLDFQHHEPTWKEVVDGLENKDAELGVLVLSDIEIETKKEFELPDELKQFEELFVDDLSMLPPKRKVEHNIDLVSDAKPVAASSYRLSPKEFKEMEEQVNHLLLNGFIKPSTSSWASPILFVKKKNGKLRMVTDFRALNKLTMRPRWPLPIIWDLLGQFEGASVFSILDMKSGFSQIWNREEDVEKTAFVTPIGQFEWRVMPFGLTGAPSTFMRLMDSIFWDMLRKWVVVYMDDILIYSKSVEEHNMHLRLVLERVKEHQLYLSKDKCKFYNSQIVFVGYIISEEGVSIDPEKIRAVKEWRAPTCKKELLSFLQFINWLRPFIKNLADCSAELSDLLVKEKQWQWTPKEEVLFEKLKNKVIEAPTLVYPMLDEPFEVWTDASNVAIGGVLLQNSQCIAFESRKLRKSEKNYHTTDKECLAIVYCLMKWKCYLEGSTFVVKTDHKALEYLMTKKELSGRQARWTEKLSQFEFKIEYVKGADNGAADALSRNFGDESEDDPDETEELFGVELATST
jgi:hypothetical protein